MIESDVYRIQETDEEISGNPPENSYTNITTSIGKRFVEPENQVSDPLEYERGGKEPGYVVIFNHENFPDPANNRAGSSEDVVMLANTLGRLGFNIDKKQIYHNLCRGKLLRTLKTIVEDKTLAEYNCLIFAIFTHGNEDNQLHVYDALICSEEIWNIFANCPFLQGKPKLFLFQACKGANVAKVDKLYEKSSLVPSSIFKSPIPPDVLIVYAAAEGARAFRDTKKGTWFIQEFCTNAMAYGKTEDVVSIITRTTKCIANTYFHIEHDEVVKQMPTLVSTLTKKFYFTRSKSRNFMLNMIQEYEEVLKSVNDLQEKLNGLYEQCEYDKNRKPRI